MKRQAGESKTFKCPDCGTKVLKQTGYCVKCQKKVKEASVVDRKLVASELVRVARLVRGSDPDTEVDIGRGIRDSYFPHKPKDKMLFLRQMTMEDVMADTDEHQLKAVFKGSVEEINAWAKKHGLVWKRSNNVFGGYYYDTQNAEAYLVTA